MLIKSQLIGELSKKFPHLPEKDIALAVNHIIEHMSTILRALQERRVMEFSELFDPGRGVPVLVVTFLALLELARELLIEITQAECFAPIYVKLAHAKPS